MNYLLLTPVRNEEKTLPKVIESVLSQELLPKLWLIINDGSTDQTQEIINKLIAQEKWVCSLELPIDPGGYGLHYATVVRKGFELLQDKANKRKIQYELIGKVDSDIILENDCFRKLVKEFELDEKMGIASPRLYFVDDNYETNKNQASVKRDVALSDHPTDGIRLYRRDCFKEIGGMLIVRATETVAEVKANLNGWKVTRIGHIHGYHLRKSHGSTPIWDKWKLVGSDQHYLGYHPLLVICSCLFDLIYKRPIYLSLAHFWGYMKALMLNDSQIPDLEVREYFGKKRLKEIIPQIPDLIKKMYS